MARAEFAGAGDVKPALVAKLSPKKAKIEAGGKVRGRYPNDVEGAQAFVRDHIKTHGKPPRDRLLELKRGPGCGLD